MTTFSFQNLSFQDVHIKQWELEPGQHWCLLGTTGSGKSRFTRMLESPEKCVPENDQSVLPSTCICVGFEAQQTLYEEELRNNDTDFMDRVDYGQTGLELLRASGAENTAIDAMVTRFAITPLLSKGFRMFSSGETRKLLIVRALLSKPDLLILEEPYDSLDVESTRELGMFLSEIKEEQRLLICVNRLQDIEPWYSHVAVLHQGHLLIAAERKKVLEDRSIGSLFYFDTRQLAELPPRPLTSICFDPLLSFENSRVRYGDIIQFQNLSWVLRPGQHTIVAGPNGAGKSTLLQMISGDHPQCFNNGVTVFNHRRGSGESIWEIKQHIGLVSGSLHQDYRVPGNALSVVASGLYDTIGIYQAVPEKEKEIARCWLAVVGLGDRANVAFRQLSWGEQRLVLIARALIKYPPLLLLDEPTLGLDDRNRFMVLACLERIVRMNISTVLFVSHRQDEHLPLFQHQLLFEPTKDIRKDGLFRIQQFPPPAV